MHFSASDRNRCSHVAGIIGHEFVDDTLSEWCVFDFSMCHFVSLHWKIHFKDEHTERLGDRDSENVNDVIIIFMVVVKLLITYLKQATTSFLVLLVGQNRITYGRQASLNLYVKW